MNAGIEERRKQMSNYKDNLKMINELIDRGVKPWIVVAPNGNFVEEWHVVRNGIKSYYIRMTEISENTKHLADAHREQMRLHENYDGMGPKLVFLD